MSDVLPSPERHERIVFFTGAGLSAECGLPTYRGRGGLWSSYDWESYACQRAFDLDPARVWTFHDERRRIMGAVAPGPAHRVIADVQRESPTTRIVTQNIDGLHQAAGAEEVIELHGSIWRVRCRCPDSPRTDRDVPIASHVCGACGAWLRPDIVWFEDPLRTEALERAMDAMLACDLLISIGTSGVVYPAAQLPRVAKSAGATCIEINPEATPASAMYDVHMRMGATEALERLWPQAARP